MRTALVAASVLVFGALSCSAAEPIDSDRSAVSADLRPLELCGNGLDEDGDGADRVCAADAPLGGGAIAVLRGTAEQVGGELFDAEVRLVPDGDPSCAGAPSEWPSVEGC